MNLWFFSDKIYPRYANSAQTLGSRRSIMNLASEIINQWFSDQSCIFSSQCFGSDMVYYMYLQFLNNVILIKTKVLLIQAYLTSADFDDCLYAFRFNYRQRFFFGSNTWPTNLLPLSVPDEGYWGNTSCTLN